MRLVASTAELVRAEIHDRTEFARLLDARVPSAWPTDEAADALPWFLERLEQADPQDVGWYGFYGVVATGMEDAPVLVGGGGCLGPPVDGSVEVGYSVLPAFQRQGYATEMMTAVLEWVSRDPRVLEITAETAMDNVPSRRLLSNLGFIKLDPAASRIPSRTPGREQRAGPIGERRSQMAAENPSARDLRVAG